MKYTINMLAIILVIAIGCESPNERLMHQLADTSQEVVQQNREIARTQHEVAEGSKRLVEAVAESRHEHNELQRDLQRQRDKLDSERRAMATQRRRESLIVPVLETTGVLLVAALPLVLSWYLLHGIRSTDEDVSDVLVQELVSDQARLLFPPPTTTRIEHDESTAESEEAESPPF